MRRDLGEADLRSTKPMRSVVSKPFSIFAMVLSGLLLAGWCASYGGVSRQSLKAGTRLAGRLGDMPLDRLPRGTGVVGRTSKRYGIWARSYRGGVHVYVCSFAADSRVARVLSYDQVSDWIRGYCRIQIESARGSGQVCYLPRAGGFNWSNGELPAVTSGPQSAAVPPACTVLTVVLPYWFLYVVLSASLLPRFVWHPCRRLYRKRQSLCECCGYDLRGGGARCPECGATVLGGETICETTAQNG